MKNTTWIIGATSGLGRKLAENVSESGGTVILSARNEHDLNDLCQDLQIRFGVNAIAQHFDLSVMGIMSDADEIVQLIISKYGLPATCFLIAGAIDESDEYPRSAELANALVKVNYTGPACILSALQAKTQNHPLRIVIASSVAAARPRSRNLAYSSAKLALENYGKGMMHALADKPVKIHIYRLGYMDTNLSYGQKLIFRPSDPDNIAKRIISDETKSSGLYYLPWYWKGISVLLNLIPFSIYKKMKF